MGSEPAIHVLHENPDWTAPLLTALDARGLPYRDWLLHDTSFDFAAPPPEGVFYNRMSASSHTRGHRFSPELTSCVLSWLERHGRRVLNGTRALALEVNKVAQYQALEAHGIATPRTVAAAGRQAILDAASRFEGPFITKHNRAGRGLGVKLFQDAGELATHIASDAFADSVDGITLLQQYVEAPDPHIVRVEFVGRRFLYAVRVDTADGFELCPADACATDPARPKFQIIDGFDHPLLAAYERFLRANCVHVAAFEFITDRHGAAYTYDVNTNTNYNSAAEAAAGVSGMAALAGYLGEELAAMSRAAA
jgi:hypothetical protein